MDNVESVKMEMIKERENLVRKRLGRCGNCKFCNFNYKANERSVNYCLVRQERMTKGLDLLTIMFCKHFKKVEDKKEIVDNGRG